MKLSLKKKKHIITLFFGKVNRFCTWERPPNIYKVARSVNGGGLVCTTHLFLQTIFSKKAQNTSVILRFFSKIKKNEKKGTCTVFKKMQKFGNFRNLID